MEPNESITLNRDVEALTVPMGVKMMLPKGSQAFVTQSLGGTYTVIVNGNMYRIDGRDADALGKASAAAPAQPAKDVPSGPVDEKEIWNVLRTCYDPEIPVNIVDLGLVYKMQVTPLPSQGNRIDVVMTLTAPGCGMGEVIKEDVRQKLQMVDGVTEAHVELTFEPQWNQGMLSDAAKLQLGLM